MQDLAEEKPMFTTEDPIQEPNPSSTEATPQDPNSLIMDHSAQNTTSEAATKTPFASRRCQYFFHEAKEKLAEGALSVDDFQHSDAEEVANALVANARSGYLNGFAIVQIALGLTFKREDGRITGIDSWNLGIKLDDRATTDVTPSDLDIKAGVGTDRLRQLKFCFKDISIPKNPLKSLVVDKSDEVTFWEVAKSGKLSSCSMNDVIPQKPLEKGSSKKSVVPSSSVKNKKSGRGTLVPDDDEQGQGMEGLELLNEAKQIIKDGLNLVNDVKSQIKENLDVLGDVKNQMKESVNLMGDLKIQIKEGFDLMADMKKQVNEGLNLLGEIYKQVKGGFNFQDVLNLQEKEGLSEESNSRIERILAAKMAATEINEKNLVESEVMIFEETMGKKLVKEDSFFMAASEELGSNNFRVLPKTNYEKNLAQKINQYNKEEEMKKQKSLIALKSANKHCQSPSDNINDDIAGDMPLRLSPKVSRDTTYVPEDRSGGEADVVVQGGAIIFGKKEEYVPCPGIVSSQDIPFPHDLFSNIVLEEKLSTIVEKKKVIMKANEKKKEDLRDLKIRPYGIPEIVAEESKQTEENKKMIKEQDKMEEEKECHDGRIKIDLSTWKSQSEIEKEMKGQEPCVEQGVKLNYEEVNYDMSGNAVNETLSRKRKVGEGVYEENKLKKVKMGAKSADGKLG